MHVPPVMCVCAIMPTKLSGEEADVCVVSCDVVAPVARLSLLSDQMLPSQSKNGKVNYAL